MKVVAFNGSPRPKGNTSILLNVVLNELNGQGIDTELVQIGGRHPAGCIACYKCFEKKDGRCAQHKDIINDCIEKMRQAEGIILGSPTYFADLSADLKAFIERCGMVSRANGDLYKRKVAAGVVAVRRAGSLHALHSINNFFLIGQMIVVGSSYWNMAIGRDPGEVENDTEGIETMKTLGRNMAWLISKIS
ncbi:MAG: flavodoxin family protein [Deltaproteobacteria bacterium]|nr:flavodoxin family protein [Deltaproteobacteria bacterium]